MLATDEERSPEQAGEAVLAQLVSPLHETTSLLGTTLASASSLLELELNQTVSAPFKIKLKLGEALSQNKLEILS